MTTESEKKPPLTSQEMDQMIEGTTSFIRSILDEVQAEHGTAAAIEFADDLLGTLPQWEEQWKAKIAAREAEKRDTPAASE
jgi:hypothetical protein